METFTEKHLVQFGQYLLSQDRKKRFRAARSKKDGVIGEARSILSTRESLALIHHADVENFKTFIEENPEVEFTPSKEVILR